MSKQPPKGILVFIEGDHSRDYVGLLKRSGERFSFQYDDAYITKGFAIPLGPALPLRKEEYILKKDELIPFLDRLPSRKNPAYEAYCKAVKIPPEEDDLFTLLSTLGHRGPSSFVFEGWFFDEPKSI